MPRKTRSQKTEKRNPNPGNRDWERGMMKQLNKDKANPDEVHIESPFGYESGSYGDFIDQFIDL